MAKWNKISLNSGKTEIVLFRIKNKKLRKIWNKPTENKWFFVKQNIAPILDKHLKFKYHLENLKLKLNRVNFIFSKVRYYVKFS